jgi:hypothetical protein
MIRLTIIAAADIAPTVIAPAPIATTLNIIASTVIICAMVMAA